MSNPYRDKLLSVGYLARGRTRARVREGRSHPETGKAFKATTTEAGTVTEHATKDDRVDALVTAPHIKIETATREVR